VVAHKAQGYKRKGSELHHGMLLDPSAELAEGGIHTTVDVFVAVPTWFSNLRMNIAPKISKGRYW
jgi:hypothetical protein